MNLTSIPGPFGLFLLLAIASGAPLVWGQNEPLALNIAAPDTAAGYAEFADPSETRLTTEQQERQYLQAIEQIESREGAYAGQLSESLLSLALTLQAQGRHEEAIQLFKRGVHLTRINEGLYCPEQITLLEGEIASHKAIQNYMAADERQNYLYRVQIKSMAGSEAMANAFMDHARWQYDAYQLNLTQNDYPRVMNMLELYRMAFEDVIAREGNKSPELLAPLQGMLKAQYLISQYDIGPTTPVTGDDGYIDETLLRFRTYHGKSYKQGNAIIKAIASIEQGDRAPDSTSLANKWVMLGDWRLWNGRTQAAWDAYREAATELARSGDAQQQTQRFFGEPVALPNIAELSALPATIEPSERAVTLAFGVGANGRVHDLERLDDNEEDDKQASRLMRQLRKTTFRPRLEAGEPVETPKLVKAFDLQ
jgi:tetratricopeptide (TPR) repeat protein